MQTFYQFEIAIITVMDYLTYSKRLAHLIDLIRKDRLASPQQLAGTYGCSEKTIRRMINLLRVDGYEIEYCKKNKKYSIKSSTVR